MFWMWMSELSPAVGARDCLKDSWSLCRILQKCESFLHCTLQREFSTQAERILHVAGLQEEAGFFRERRESMRRKLETSGGNVGGGGAAGVFCGLQKGFLLRNSEHNLQQIPDANIAGLRKGFLLGKDVHLSSDIHKVSCCRRNNGPAKSKCPTNSLSSGPCRALAARDSPCLQQTKQQEWSKESGGDQIPQQGDEENKNKIKLKCKNVFKTQHDLRQYVDQMKMIDWKHPDVEAAIGRHPRLHWQIREARFVQTMKWLYDDPEGFLQHFEESDEELIFIRELLEVIGKHLQKHSNTSTKNFLQSLGLSAESEEKLNKISEHPEINSIINDPHFRKILRQMSKDPVQAQRMLEVPELRAKLMTLVSAGVLDLLLSNNSSI